MTIVGKIMDGLNPQHMWRGDLRVGDPVVIKSMVLEALDKRRDEKLGRKSNASNEQGEN